MDKKDLKEIEKLKAQLEILKEKGVKQAERITELLMQLHQKDKIIELLLGAVRFYANLDNLHEFDHGFYADDRKARETLKKYNEIT